jgi:hypothetical protein
MAFLAAFLGGYHGTCEAILKELKSRLDGRSSSGASGIILVTGNPQGDDELMYNSLRHGKFHDFISKPLDLETDFV